jgi:hypothetical protein
MPSDHEQERDRRAEQDAEPAASRPPEPAREERDEPPNPPRTTTGVWTSPKFGSAGSGGAELEPGPERD